MGKFSATCYECLSVHVRQNAYLNTAPENPDADKSKPPSPTRLKLLQDKFKNDDYMPDMPDAGPAEHLIVVFYEIGPTLATGYGPGPLTHTEIDAWQRNSGVELSAWEADTLRRLSIDYINETHRAKEHKCEPPWRNEQSIDIDRLTAANALEAAMEKLSEL